jgi:hypothetical protein
MRAASFQAFSTASAAFPALTPCAVPRSTWKFSPLRSQVVPAIQKRTSAMQLAYSSDEQLSNTHGTKL